MDQEGLMKDKLHRLGSVAPCALALIAIAGCIAGCKDPTHPDLTPTVSGLEDCAPSADWLPNTPEFVPFDPLPHPATECPFYRSGWQNFLRAMQPVSDTDGTPSMLVNYKTIDDVFTMSRPKGATLGLVRQAGERKILIDQNGHTLYYGIHVNQAFADFIHRNHLETARAIQDYPTANPNLFFDAGVAEFKSAWQMVDEADPDNADYITAHLTVPHLSQAADGSIVEDATNPQLVFVRLLAIHVVTALTGHPEFVWASFEHSTGTPDTKAADGHRNLAPIVPTDENPTADDLDNRNISAAADTLQKYLLYKDGTPINTANTPIDENKLRLDEATQTFYMAADNSLAQSSIYRVYPASKSNTKNPDDAVTTLNMNTEALFAMNAAANTLSSVDKRGHYRLLGAQWMDKPAYLTIDARLQNDENSPFVTGPHINQEGVMVDAVAKQTFLDAIKTDGSDSELSILGGEDRMSSTAMESFTQTLGGFPNCFNCHNTQAISDKGVPMLNDQGGIKLLDPGLLNVSHVLSEVVFEDCGATPANIFVTDTVTGAREVRCP
jgi:hypothetical protein